MRNKMIMLRIEDAYRSGLINLMVFVLKLYLGIKSFIKGNLLLPLYGYDCSKGKACVPQNKGMLRSGTDYLRRGLLWRVQKCVHSKFLNAGHRPERHRSK